MNLRTLVFSLLLICTHTLSSQEYEPNTRWPYIYENFTQGNIFTKENKKIIASLNIHLWGNVLHYIDTDGKIYKADDSMIERVEIGKDTFIYYNHEMVKIIATEQQQLLVSIVRGDFNAMQEGSGAYGANLNSSATRLLSSLNLGGLNCPDLAQLEQQRYEGRAIPLVESYYFILNGTIVDANCKSVEKHMGSSRAEELKLFMKNNKTKWKDKESLSALLRFMAR